MVTMQNIGDVAGVSRGTVSYVLNGKHKKAKISEKTREKILRIAKELGYRPNELARSIKTGKTRVVGVAGGFQDSYSMDILNGISDVIVKNRFSIKLMSFRSYTNIENILEHSVDSRIQGMILYGSEKINPELLERTLKNYKIPLVRVGRSSDDAYSSRVFSDDIQGAVKAINHFLKLRHRNIAFLTMEHETDTTIKRLEGYRKAMKQAGLESFIKVFKVKDVGKNFKAEVDELCDRIVNVEKSTAIFCYSDPLAMRVLNSIWRKGIKIPEDLSVIGYGGLNYTEFSNPPLSTIKQPFFEMGCEAGKIIIQQINGGISSPVKKSLGVKLISRESTAINKGNRENE